MVAHWPSTMHKEQSHKNVSSLPFFIMVCTQCTQHQQYTLFYLRWSIIPLLFANSLSYQTENFVTQLSKCKLEKLSDNLIIKESNSQLRVMHVSAAMNKTHLKEKQGERE